MASFPSRRSRGFWLGGLLRRRRKDRSRERGGWSAAQAPEQLEQRQLMAADSSFSYDAYSSYDPTAAYSSYDSAMYGPGMAGSGYSVGYSSGDSSG